MTQPEPTTPKLRPSVEFTPEVLDGLWTHVTESFDPLARGGLESGGVLFGNHFGRSVLVGAFRPAFSAYGQGPVLKLDAEADRELERVSALPQADPELAGMEPVGLYLSNLRDNVTLRSSEKEIFDHYFRGDWQAVLLIRPGRMGSLRAATLVRGDWGSECIVLDEFTLRQRASAGSRPAEFRAPEPATPAVKRRAPVERDSAPPFTSAVPPRTRSRWWMPAAVVAVLALAGAAAMQYFGGSDAPMGLQAFERDGIMHIEWNAGSGAVTHAASGRLEVTDGSATSVRTLTREELRRGLYPVLRKQSDFAARLQLYDVLGKVRVEQVHFAGRPVLPEVTENGEAARSRPAPNADALKRENAALRGNLARERRRADALQSRVKVLQSIVQARTGR